jgi:anthranilate phosphoribosyltransferase
MNISEAIAKLVENQNLTGDEMSAVMRAIMTGECTDAQIAGFLIALRMKGETVAEISAAAQVMRDLSSKVEVGGDCLVDMVGTGGDATGTFNISTASSIVIAAAGGTVAKHGNRSVSSKSGSADLLEAAGVNLNLNSTQVAEVIDEVGLGFMFAPMHHSAMKYAIGPRKEMGVRTVFNLLGPLTNPAGVKRQLTGVFAREWVEPVAEVLKELGTEQAMVVHSEDGMDEISISAPTFIAELKDGEISTRTITPEEFGFNRADLKDIQVLDSTESLNIINSVLDNTSGPALDIILLNAGAAVYVSGCADSIEAGVEKAKTAIASGAAKKKLADLVAASNKF